MMFHVEQLTDSGLVPIEEAAAALGIDVKRLRGYVWRNSLRDPIGDANQVYGWSCKALADTSSAVVNSDG